MRKTRAWGASRPASILHTIGVLFILSSSPLTLCGNLYGQGKELEKIAPKAASVLRSTILYFGENVRFSSDIASEANIPARELLLTYKFSGDERIEAPYQAPFVGERIPGYARKVEVELYRTASGTEKQLLWSNIYETQQIPPTFNTSQISIEATSGKGKAAKSGECVFAIKGLRVDFAKPVDTEKNRVVTALVNDLEVAEPALDSSRTQIQFFTGNKTDEKLNSALKAESMSIAGFFDAGVFLVTIGIKNLPKGALKGKTLRGTIGIRLNVRLLNRRAMRSAAAEETVLVPIELLF
ncbi:MAG: hypothetical protein JNN25_05445 [Candidatus Kapabacteria bacterium]|nr:hypothetical protein [Candidatus Kapabacteria bacterium]